MSKETKIDKLRQLISNQISQLENNSPLFLIAEDKTIIAAAILAALHSDAELVIPYSCSTRVIEDSWRLTSCSHAIIDKNRTLPPTVKKIKVTPISSGNRCKWPAPPRPNNPDQTILNLFTGGTTGQEQIWPKTVHNLLAEAEFLCRHFQIDKNDCILATVPPYHIYGLLFSVIIPLVSGAAVIKQTPTFPADIGEIINQEQVTVIVSTPAHYRIIGDKKIATPELRLAFSSAAPLSEEDNHNFYHHNQLGITEIYGSTETGGIASRNRQHGEDCFIPFSSIKWQIKEDRLAINSPYLSPSLPKDREGFFLTNDLVEKSGAGFILKGRYDSIVKVGGKRVDMNESQNLINDFDQVKDCFVFSQPTSGTRGNTIYALVEGNMDVKKLKTYLQEKLEPCAIPKQIKVVKKIPRKDNGKFDRKTIIGLFK